MYSIPMRSDWPFACFGSGERKSDGERVTDTRAWLALTANYQVRTFFGCHQVLRRNDANILLSVFAREYLEDGEGRRRAGVAKVVRDDRDLAPVTQSIPMDYLQDVPRRACVAVHRRGNERMRRGISSRPTAPEIASSSRFNLRSRSSPRQQKP